MKPRFISLRDRQFGWRWLPLWGLVLGGCNSQAPAPATSTTPVPALSATTTAEIETFCGACHRLPAAEHFPQTAWHHEVERGFGFYVNSGRTDLDPPALLDVVTYFRKDAPEKLLIPPIPGELAPSPLKFEQQAIPATDASEVKRAIAGITWLPPEGDQPGELLACDMSRGDVLRVDLGIQKAKLFSKLHNPAQIRVADLNQDGQRDYVVADLGSFLPADHHEGSVEWIVPGKEAPQVIRLMDKIGRVADVRVADLDADGDADVVVGEFGWHKTGSLHWLENVGLKEGLPQFKPHKLDPRTGVIHAPVLDLEKKGSPGDLVALFSQEHETIVAFLNQGKGQFEQKVIGGPYDPSFGSSGIEMADLDGDGDQDVLYCNGDTFDSMFLKPCHGIRWLENQGRYPFEDHPLTPMPGVQKAIAVDLDQDKDLDIVAVALLPTSLLSQEPEKNFDSLIWLEQTAPGKYVRHTLETGSCRHAALEAGDFDGDGDLDLAVGNFMEQNAKDQPPLSIWWNPKIKK